MVRLQGQTESCFGSHRQPNLLKLGEKPGLMKAYRGMLETPWGFTCSLRLAFEAGSIKGWELLGLEA